MTTLATTIFRHVREMGVENMWEDRKRPNCVSALHSLLRATKQPYPKGTYVGRRGRRGSCDVVFNGNWIEVKFAWTYKDIPPFEQRNISYKKHFLTDIDESALKDVRDKLPSLIGQPGITRIGLLLVCLDSPQCPLPEGDIEALEIRGNLRDGNWARSDLGGWQNPWNDGCQIRAYFWERSALQEQ
jgi:hypothetical protein